MNVGLSPTRLVNITTLYTEDFLGIDHKIHNHDLQKMTTGLDKLEQRQR